MQIGTEEFSKEAAADPFAFATLVRKKLTDEKRLVRIYGSEVVLARMNGDATHVRVHLINYGGGKVDGLESAGSRGVCEAARSRHLEFKMPSSWITLWPMGEPSLPSHR